MRTDPITVRTGTLLRLTMSLLLLVGMFGFLPAGNASALDSSIIYVNADAMGLDDGTSWADAYTDLQDAIFAAVPGNEIWVAAGTYHPTSEIDNQSATFVLETGVGIYGGFTGTETAKNERNPKLNITTLSGDIGVPGDADDNSYHVVTGSGTDNTAVLDGFTITSGNAREDAADLHGGGMLNRYGSPTLSNLIISGNTGSYGGGMFNYSASPTLTDVTFSNNSASRAGGMYNHVDSDPILTNVTFTGNSAETRGGGMTSANSSPTLTNVTFSGNSAFYGGGLHNAYGGNPILKHVTFSGNTAYIQGGGIFNEDSNPTIINGILYNNDGGEIYDDGTSTPAVSHSIVKGGFDGTGNLDVNPLLGPLQNNGGYTQTMALGASSPAINMADDDNCSASDQRGVIRPQGAQCDIGAYELDNTAPTVTSVTSDSADDTYLFEETLTISVTFSEIITVTGTPQLTLETGAINRAVNYSSGSGTDTLEFIYTVQAYDTSIDLDYVSSTALALAGGTLKDTASNNAILSLPTPGSAGSLGYNKAIVIDGTPPNNIDVTIAGDLKGSYYVPEGSSLQMSYTGVNNGPVKVINVEGDPLVASERVTYTPDGGVTYTSYSELMGLPDSQLTHTYWFPFYNSLQLNTFLSFANVGTSNTTVTVTIGGDEVGSYLLAPNESKKIKYPNLNTGPVKVQGSDPNVPIIASERISYTPNGTTFTNYSELMGLPASQLTHTYWFPFYNSSQLNTFLSVSNVGASNTTVTVTIGGNQVDSYVLTPNQSRKIKYDNLNTGPVKIQGSNASVPIITSERISYAPGGDTNFTSFSELMGLPNSQLSNTAWFPFYNSSQHATFLSFSNIGTQSTTVTVTIGGVEKGSYLLAPNESKKIKYDGLNTGPVKIQGSNASVPIIASSRVSYTPNGITFTSFSEMLGLPEGLLDDIFWFPWYNSLQLNTELRFGVP